MAATITTRNTLLMAFGVGAGPLAQLLATYWLARIYQPTDFGSLALFLSLAGIVVAISCLRYEIAVPVVADQLVPATVWVAIASAILVSLTIMLAIGLHLPQTISLRLEDLGQQIWGVPVFGVCGGIVLVGLQLTLRRSEFALNALIRSAQTLLFVTLALLYTNIGLVQLIILSSSVIALLVGVYLIKNVPIIKLGEIWRVARENKQYPTLMVPASFIDALAIAAPIYFISTSYGVEATGNYSQIQKLVGTPLALAGAVAGQLFLKRSSELFRSDQTSIPLLWKVFGALCLIAGALLIFLIIFGEYALGMLLGPAWRVDTWFLLLATAPLILRLTVSPVSMIFITHNKIGISARWQLFYFLSTVGVMYSASQYLIFENFLALYALHEIVAYSVYLYLAHRLAKNS